MSRRSASERQTLESLVACGRAVYLVPIGGKVELKGRKARQTK
jgi:hypothetical protein